MERVCIRKLLMCSGVTLLLGCLGERPMTVGLASPFTHKFLFSVVVIGPTLPFQEIAFGLTSFRIPEACNNLQSSRLATPTILARNIETRRFWFSIESLPMPVFPRHPSATNVLQSIKQLRYPLALSS